jgi:hypothetical protein
MSFFEHNGVMTINQIPEDIQNDIMECVQNVKHSGEFDSGIKAADRVEAFISKYKKAEKDAAEEEAIMAEAKEAGISYGAKDLKELRENLEDVAGSWNGEDDSCMGSGVAGGDMISEEDAGTAQELIERIDALTPTAL